jgi:hypothetical protein
MRPHTPEEEADEVERAGLCATCRHSRRISSDRGTSYILCRLSGTDSRFAKYPRLPMKSCAGYDVKEAGFDSRGED